MPSSGALYILMRNDIESMTPGKACAQAAHAANAFGAILETLNDEKLTEWKTQSNQSFGTTLVLGADYDQILDIIDIMASYGYITDIIHDSTYPIRDGRVTHLIPLDTCAYVFIPNKENDRFATEILGELNLF